MRAKLCFRWYGEGDAVPIEYIAQIPQMKHVVSAVYDVCSGEVWKRESIRKLSDDCKRAGLQLSVIESIPVHEDIKLGRARADEYIKNYAENIRRVASVGVDCVTYNFMPVFDWTRTQTDKRFSDGSSSLVMYKEELLKIDPTKDDVSLPGWDESYTKAEIGSLIGEYKSLGEEGLWSNLEKFLGTVIPVAEECGVKMAIHPDDPPYSVFGIPRIITCEENADRVLSLYESECNCLCFCTGSFGCAADNDIYKMIEKYASAKRIAFVHMRNVRNMADGSFEEVAHPSSCGSLDMARIAKILVESEYDGYIRPDHGRMIWGESGRAGYGLYDRALGASYISGLFEAYERLGEMK